VNTFSQFTQQWVSRYNGTANGPDWANALVVGQSGFVYVTGYSTNTVTNKDLLTIKYDNTGNILWSAGFNGPVNGGDYAFSVAADNSGNVYVTGRSDQGASLADYTTIKYNSNGVQQWAALYNGTGNGVDEARVVRVDNSGNVYVSGKSLGVNTDYDIVTIKYDQNGSQLWVQRYDGPGHNEDVASAMVLDASANVYVTGSSIGLNSGSDYVTIKYNSSGVQQWVNRYNGQNNSGDFATDIKVDNSGNVYVTGACDDGSVFSYDYVTIKYNSSGIQQWLTVYDGPAHRADVATALDIDASGNVFVTGKSTGPSIITATDSNFATIKYNSAGIQQWVTIYEGPNYSSDVSRAIVVDHSGNIVVTGSSTNTQGTQTDYVTIKYNQSGAQQWIDTYNGPGNGNDFTSSLAIDNSNYIYVTGRSYGNGTDYDYATIKYSDLLGIRHISGEVPDKFSLSQNYPNPFNPETKIKFDLPSAGIVAIKVYNILGNEISIIVNDYLQPGSYEVKFNGNNFGSGVYFYKLISQNYSNVKKMMLIK